MDESKKKPIMIGLIVVCLGVAGMMFLKSGPEKHGIDSVRGEPMWMKCKKCQAEYEMDKADYLTFIKENMTGVNVPGLPCKECQVEKAYKAYKCPKEKCGKVFRPDMNANDYQDRCPSCKYSPQESQGQ